MPRCLKWLWNELSMSSEIDPKVGFVFFFLGNITEARHLRSIKRDKDAFPRLCGRVYLTSSMYVLTESDAMNREASERFAAGYIQCMHEVHMYVSSCPGIDPTVAAELLNHLLECMPLNEDNFQDMLVDLMSDVSDSSSSNSTLPTGNGSGVSSAAVGAIREVTSAFSPALSTTSSDDFYSDLDETDVEQSHNSSENHPVQPTTAYFKSIWRPW